MNVSKRHKREWGESQKSHCLTLYVSLICFMCWCDFAFFQDPASRQWSLCLRPLFLPRTFNRSCLCLFLRIAWARQPQAQSWYESGQYNSELQVFKWRCSVQLYQRVSRYNTFSFCGLVCLKNIGWIRSKALNCELLGKKQLSSCFILFFQCLFFASLCWAL